MKKTSLLLWIGLSLGITAKSQNNFALDLDGTNDKIGVVDAVSLNPTSAITVEAWINADTWKSNVWAGTIISKQAGSPDRGYSLSVGENGKVDFTVSVGNVWKSATSAAIISLNSWTHVAGVYNGSSVKIFVNGILKNETATTGAISVSTGTTMYIGENPTWTGRYFDGTIDEVRIWNIARTDQEIAASFENSLTLPQTGLVAYFPMNEGSGTAVGDSSGQINNGTMVNMDASTDWVGGFEVATEDVSVTCILSPTSFVSNYGSAEKVSVIVSNLTANPISNVPVGYKINNGSVVTDTIHQTIAGLATSTFTFPATVDLLALDTLYIQAFTTLSSDDNKTNDTLKTMVNSSLTGMIFDGEQHNFSSAGQLRQKKISLPDTLINVSQILLHVDLRCPSGGCDPWDQYACIRLVDNEGETWELARYITPYGKACGDWVFDITDFKSKLKGNVMFESYIQVWGASGWLVDAELEFVSGTPQFKYIKIDKLWNNDYQVYGDPAISYDLNDTTVIVHPNTQAMKIRLTTTGHGQANTGNAAEFMDVTHQISVNGANAFDHHLWNADCNVNTCSAQSGTWQYARAGWCPGQDVQPDYFDLQAYLQPLQSITLDYILADYTNLLNTGYNGSSHTEPFYRIHGYLVSYGNSPLIGIQEHNKNNLDAFVYPNPSTGEVSINFTNLKGNTKIMIYNVQGSLQQNFDINVMGNITKSFDLSMLSKGMYFINIISESGTNTQKLILK